ncbi:GspE/PulE family protein [Oceanibacterium hippocampi]|uniref:Type II secretion system protein E n=1 Tax=Oceanibacterium hippocampi TaxID=745714 RepID=A0A1Y5T775_9PROT|nr:ATPase, T2SS/T4P/T4SS family [Oceanibacterium hippocampi]SLN57151.1 Type II secretion system protein E [Oceanibacterium hippocampi]
MELGDILIERKLVDGDGLARAQALNRASGERLDIILTRLGLVPEGAMAAALAGCLDLPLAAKSDYPDKALFADTVTPGFLHESRVLPIGADENGVDLAMCDPLSDYAAEAIRLIVGRPVRRWVAVPADLEAALGRLYGTREEGAAPVSSNAVASGDVERLKDMASDAPVIRLVNDLIARAAAERASDIHVEPFEADLRIRFRIDGVLRPQPSPGAGLQAAITSRVKVMAGLDIAERRLAQDGRFKMAVRGREIDIRVSVVPTMHGESVVLRLLDREQAPLELKGLGFSAPILAALDDLLERPNGIILVTGPTGSGKTTTLYAALDRLNGPGAKILTAEDPIEYQIKGINQIQVRPKIGLTFASILRSILRQDPDIMMVGEIRDLETAEIAVQAALTGHLVLSTLHTNDAAGAVARLLDMGVEDYLLTSALKGILAQRLVRTFDPELIEPYEPLPELVAELGLDRLSDGPPRLWRPKPDVGERAYRGRTTIAEYLPVTEAIRRLILQRADRGEIARQGAADGMGSMADDGLRKALSGITSIEEVLRVTHFD